MPGEEEPLWDAEVGEEKIGSRVDLIVDAPVGEGGATTVVSFEEGYPVVVREGAGDTALFD